MQEAASQGPPRWYRAVAVLALLWMLVGVVTWFMDLITDESTLTHLSEAQRQLYADRPGWLSVVYSAAVLSGLAGAVGLLRRRRWAASALWLSLAAVVIQFGYTMFGMRAVERLGAAMALPLPVTVFVIGAALLWLSLHARARGWLRD